MQDSFDDNELTIQDWIVRGGIHDEQELENTTYYAQPRDLETDAEKYVSIRKPY